ncbi:MAG TPA: Xaa-Pro peptidase family protein [Ktedonobacteraceae bacterium]|nr:Xaa-Pro peptidase family protein [Ktedonobacteraceae bacterium]
MAKDQERVNRARRILQEAGLDVVICRLPENVLYLTGYWPVIGASLVVFDQDGNTSVIMPHEELDYTHESWVEDIRTFPYINMTSPADPNRAVEPLLRAVIKEKGYEKSRVGYEGSFELIAANNVAAEARVPGEALFATLRKVLPEASLVDAAPALKRARAVKSSQEIEKLRICNEVAVFGLKAAREVIQAGAKESTVAGAIEGAIYGGGVGYKGVERARGFCFAMSGPRGVNAWRPFCMSSSKTMVEGEPVLIELDTFADGYYNDLTRTFTVGKPSQKAIPVFEAVNAAIDAVLDNLKPGVAARELDAVARKVIIERGYGEYFPHQLGHGVGLQFHDPIPTLHPGSEDIMEVGMTFAIEPAIYIPGWGAVRIEENIVLTETGYESLCPFPRWELA